MALKRLPVIGHQVLKHVPLALKILIKAAARSTGHPNNLIDGYLLKRRADQFAVDGVQQLSALLLRQVIKVLVGIIFPSF